MNDNNIFIYLYAILSILAIPLTKKIYIHHMKMFQQSSYRPERFTKWLKNNKQDYRVHYIGVMLFFCFLYSLVYSSLIIHYIISALYTLFIVSLYILYFKVKTSNIKPLVYTSRVKRMFVTISIFAFSLYAIVLTIQPTSANKDFIYLPVFIVFFTSFAPFIIMLANLCNSPIEKSIRNKFINEAKSMLDSHKNLITIGITGSYGKTSMKNYLTELLKVKFNVLMTPESYNTPMGVVKTIRENLTGVTEIFVCEMGAKNQYDIKELCDIAKPDHAILTAIGPQHLETFKTIDTIVKTKYELVDSIQDNGIVLLNGDSKLITENLPKKQHFTYSYKNPSHYKPYNVTLSEKGTTFTLETEKEKCEFTTKLIGEHNVLNLVGAIIMCNKLGISLEELKPQVAKIAPVPHRLEVKKSPSMTIIDDAFNSNPEGAKSALDTLNMFDGHKVLITPGMVELGDIQDDENYKFAVNATKICDYIILVGPIQTEPMQKALSDENFDKTKFFVAKNFPEAYAKAQSLQTEQHKYVLIENDLPDNYQK